MENIEQTIQHVQSKMQIESFNEMQLEAFEFIPNGIDTILVSATGSGKTLAFLIPLIHQLQREISRTQVLIIAPTRELALQIQSVLRNLAFGLNIECCYGGHPIRFEKKALMSDPEIIIGTPGRIQDHLDRENIDLTSLKFLVLDEFDKTLEMGFHKQMEAIVKHIRYKPQYILTSATDGIEIPSFIPLYEPQKISFSKAVESNLQLLQVNSPSKDKLESLYYLLNDIAHESTFVFCNYRDSVERVSNYLKDHKIHNNILHGGLNQIDRENVLSQFRNGSIRLLITTDLAGRGLDIPEVNHVVHYHHAITPEIYTHRNGRTARMNAEGNAYIIKSKQEELPEYIPSDLSIFKPSKKIKRIANPKWVTLSINKGKRDKINKIDIVGFLSKIGGLKRDELGLVEVKESYSLAGVDRAKAKMVLANVNGKKVKGKKAYTTLLG